MASLKTPGLQFYAEQVDPLHLEGGPRRNELYVVCQDGSIQSAHEPNRPVGWELIEGEFDDWYYRMTQANHPRKRCAVRYHSRTDAPPVGCGRIGSVERPQNAEVIEQMDEGDEVSSKMRGLCG